MIKGSVMLKSVNNRKWVDIFDAWFDSGHAVIVVHCDSWQEVRNAQKSAANYKIRRNVKFWTHTYGNDLYLLNPEAIKETAMEVSRNEKGVIYFYDSKSDLRKLRSALSTNQQTNS